MRIVAGLLAAAIAGPAFAADCGHETRPPDLLAASIRGRELIRQAAERMGGPDRLADIKRLRQVSEGMVSNGLQGHDPAGVDAPDLKRRFTRQWELDFEGRRHRRVSALRFDGATLNFIDSYSGGRLWTASPDRKLIWTRDGSESGFTDSLLRYAPPLLIARALERIATATWAGEDCAVGDGSDAVDFSWNDRVRLRLHIGRADRRLLRLDAIASDPLLGDDIVSYDYEGELRAGGVTFPARVVYRRRGAIFSDVTFSNVEVNPPFDPEPFDPPAGLTEVPSPAAAYPIGDGAYEMAVGDGVDNYVQYFDLGDSVAVFDAPLSDEVSRRIVEQVRSTLGPKPIAYVVLSHFHDDHIGGIGHFIGLGARIITTRDTEDVVRRIAGAASRLAGAAPPPLLPIGFSFVGDSPLVLPGTNGRSLTIYRLSGLPHVASMLVAYYPKASLIADADLVSEFAPFDDNGLIFARWLKRPGAPKAGWSAGGHHRRISAAALQAQARTFRADEDARTR
jgi:hypothetical protein